MQSQSFAGSLEASIALRNLSVTGSAIAFLWLLSPLGGQSSLRILPDLDADIQSQITIVGATADRMLYFGGLSNQIGAQNVINALISASLLTPDSTRYGPTDAWGNIKIPSSSYLINLEADTWYNVDTGAGDTNYSSLIGVATWGHLDQGSTIFSLAWPIFDVDCHRELPGYTELEWCYFALDHIDPDRESSSTTQQQCSYNETTHTVEGPTHQGPGVLTSYWSSSWNSTSQLNISSRPQYMNITFSMRDNHTIDNVAYPGSKISCELRTIRVDAEVVCNYGSCGVSRFRRSKDPRPDFINPVSIQFTCYRQTLLDRTPNCSDSAITLSEKTNGFPSLVERCNKYNGRPTD